MRSCSSFQPSNFSPIFKALAQLFSISLCNQLMLFWVEVVSNRSNPNADINRCAWPGDLNRRIRRSRVRVGWWEFSARLFNPLCWRCSTFFITCFPPYANVVWCGSARWFYPCNGLQTRAAFHLILWSFFNWSFPCRALMSLSLIMSFFALSHCHFTRS